MRKSVWYACMGVLTVILIALDQWTKALAISHLEGKEDVVLLPGVLQLHYLQNTGAAFSMLEGRTFVFYVLTPVLCVAILYVFFKAPLEKRFLPIHLCCVFLIAGAVGNYVDRLRFGYVTDFIYFSLINFPVFNVADIYVTGSMAIAMLAMLVVYKEEDLEWMFGKRK